MVVYRHLEDTPGETSTTKLLPWQSHISWPIVGQQESLWWPMHVKHTACHFPGPAAKDNYCQ